MDHYSEFLSFEPIHTKEPLLQMRIAPPLLSTESAADRRSTKDRRKKRLYPDALYEWEQFDVEVNAFSDARTEVGITETQDPFQSSLGNRTSVCDESREAFYPEQHVLHPLSEMELMRYESDYRVNFIIGQPDGVMIKNTSTQAQEVAACCEIKSTQDLLIPDDIDQVIEEYRKALGSQNQMGRRSQSRACPSIGQLMGYMVDNMTRYGILTSGTKTYFLFLSGTEDDSVDCKLQITPAWFIGQENFLKAWACFYKLASGGESLPRRKVPVAWLENTPSTSNPPGLPPPDGDDAEHTRKRSTNRVDIEDSEHGTRETPPAMKWKSGEGGGSRKTRTISELSSISPYDDDDDDNDNDNDNDNDYPENGLN